MGRREKGQFPVPAHLFHHRPGRFGHQSPVPAGLSQSVAQIVRLSGGDVT